LESLRAKGILKAAFCKATRFLPSGKNERNLALPDCETWEKKALRAMVKRMEYEKMLERLHLSLPSKSLSKERFEMPVVDSFNQGQKTVVKNFSAILKAIRRDEKHLLKYLTKELAAPASTEENRLVLNGKFSQPQLQQAFEAYIKTFVLCRECNRPDTKIIDRQGVKILHCEACGALHPVKGV